MACVNVHNCPIPCWARKFDGYIPMEAFEFEISHIYTPPVKSILVKYRRLIDIKQVPSPCHARECSPEVESFATLDFVSTSPNTIFGQDIASGTPFKQMVNMLLVHKGKMSNGLAKRLAIASDGRLTSGFRAPDLNDVELLINELLWDEYPRWSKFPDVEDFAKVQMLYSALEKIYEMKMEMDERTCEKSIAKMRCEIANMQDEIEEMEVEMNAIYEDGAESLNLLEEHGYKLDVENLPDDVYGIKSPTYHFDEAISSPF